MRHQGDVQCLIAVGFGVGEPVAQTVGVALVYLRDGYIDVEALVDFLVAIVGREYDAHSQDVVNLVERHMLVLHLQPDAVWRLDAFLYFIVDAHLLQFNLDGYGEFIEQLMTFGMRRS